MKFWSHNNNIKDFETADYITKYLKEQFAGLFKQFMDDRSKVEEILDIKDIKETAKTLHELVDYPFRSTILEQGIHGCSLMT